MATSAPLRATEPSVAMGARAAGGATLDLAFDSARSARGMIRICLTSNPRHFPNCAGDADARRLSVPAGEPHARFTDLPAGTYAVSLIHDENSNGRMDMALMMPREGFGFSRNPRIGMGPPRFDAAAFALTGGHVQQRLRIRYML